MKFKWALIGIALMLFASGCTGPDDPIQAREHTAQNNSGDIVIGVAWPFKARNDLFKEGIELALKEVNQQGVLGKKLKLVQEDDQSSVTTGMSVAQSFSNTSNMVAMIGHRSSVVAVPASKIYAHAGLLMLAPGSTSPQLTSEANPYIFRTIPSDAQIGKQAALYAASKNYRNVAIFYTSDEYGRGLANLFEDSANKSGIRIIDRISDYKDSNDLKRIVDKWRLLECDAVFLAETAVGGAEFIVRLREAGLKAPVIGGDGLDSDDLLRNGGSAVEGTVVASIFNPNDTRDETKRFVEQFRGAYKAEPSKWAAQGYDALKLLASAIEKSGSTVPAQIAVSLKEMKSWQGATGVHSFDSNGDVRDMPIVIKRVRNGKFENLD